MTTRHVTSRPRDIALCRHHHGLTDDDSEVFIHSLQKYEGGRFLVFGYFAARKINTVWTGLDLKSKSSAKYFSGPIQTNI